jgi:putative hydrolase of the HAD superfamily
VPHALPLDSILPAPSFPPPGIRWVVFDVVGTLVEPWPAVSVAYQRAAAREGIECRPEELKSSFATAWRRQELIDAAAPTPFATSRAREMERWRGIVHDVFADITLEPVRERIFRALWDHFADPAAWRPLERGTQLVHAAIDAGCGVVLASNFDERLLAIAGRLEPLVHANHVFASSELGWRKPAAAFFREVEKRLGCGADQLVLVGDDPQLDVAAARAAGWRAVAIGE